MARSLDVLIVSEPNDAEAARALLDRLVLLRRRGLLGACRTVERELSGQPLIAHLLTQPLVVALLGSDRGLASVRATPWEAPGHERARAFRVALVPLRALSLLPACPEGGEAPLVLPRDGRAVASFSDPEEAWKSIVADIEAIALEAREAAAPAPAPPAARTCEPFFLVPFQRSGRFVDRDAELSEVHALLQQGLMVGIRPAREAGGGGIGLTALAIEYAHRHRGDYPGGVFWLRGARSRPPHGEYVPDDWLQPFHERIPTYLFGVWLHSATNLSEYLNERHDALAVIDGVEDLAELEASSRWACRVLFTTVKHHLSMPHAGVDVGPLPEEAARALLTGDAAREPEATAGLARLLGAMPLALRLVAAHLAEHPTEPVAGLLERLRRALPEGAEEAGRASREGALASAFGVAWGALESDAAREVLAILAVLEAPGAIVPRARIAYQTGLEGAPLEESIALLVRRGLVEETTSGALYLHPLLTPLVASRVEDREQLARRCSSRFVAALSDVERLEREIIARGARTLLADLSLCQHTVWRSVRYDEPMRHELDALIELLRDAMAPDRQRPATPAFFLQQIRHADASARTPTGLGARAEALLAARALPHLVARGNQQAEYRNGIRAVCMASDGSVAVTASVEGHVELWDAERYEMIRAVACSGEYVSRCRIAADGLVLAKLYSEQGEARIELWDLTSGQKIASLVEKQWLSDLALTNDGRFLALVTLDNDVIRYDLREPSAPRRRSLGLADDEARRMRFIAMPTLGISADGGIVVFAASDDTLAVWDVAADEVFLRRAPGAGDRRGPFGRIPQHEGLALAADGRTAFTITSTGRLVTWEVDRAEGHLVSSQIAAQISNLAATPDGQFVVLAMTLPNHSGASWHGPRSALQIWERGSGQLVAELLGANCGAADGAGLATDGRKIVVAGRPSFLEWVRPGGAVT